MKQVSIVIPVYNAAAYLADAIDSILQQTFQDFEIICVDDGSSDNSMDILMEYARKLPANTFRILSNGHHGVATARNTGTKAATGRYLAFLDSDDLWKKEKLEKQLRFQKEYGTAFTFTGYEFADKNGMPNGKVVRVPAQLSYEEALKNTVIFTSAVLFDRKQIPEQLLLMPENCSREDTATWWQILRTGVTAYGLDESLSFYRRHDGSLSANKLKAVRGTWRMYREQEHLNRRKAIFYMGNYLYGAVKRRL